MRNPFVGMRSALLEFKNFRASGWLMFSICTVALIPLIYAGLFLLAFLDPYGSLANVPAAVVNLDEGAVIDDEQRNVGQELCDELVQNNEDATFARKLKKTDGLIVWSDPVLVIERKIRAYSPWPGCYTFLPERFRKKGNSGRVVITKAEIVNKMEPSWKDAAPGTVLKVVTSRLKDAPWRGTGPIVKCGETALMLTELKPEGSSLMDGGAFLRGRPLVEGDVLLAF